MNGGRGATKEEAMELIKLAQKCQCEEMAYAAGVMALGDLLTSLGHGDLVCEFLKIKDPFSVVEKPAVTFLDN